MKDKIKIITLGDIFKNLETEEKAFNFKDYIINLQEDNAELRNEVKELERMCELYGKSIYNAELTDYKSRNEKAQDLILNELSHLKANDEETWNKEFYDENNKLDYRKLCIELLNQVINLLNGDDEE